MNNEIITIEEIYSKLLKTLRLLKKSSVTILLIASVFAVVFSFLKPDTTYKASTTFLLKGKKNSGGLLNFASKFGLGSENQISVDKIKAVGKSDKLLISLISEKNQEKNNSTLLGESLIHEFKLDSRWEEEHPSFLNVNLKDSTAVRDSVINIILSRLIENISIEETNDGLVEIMTISKNEYTSYQLNKQLLKLIENYFLEFEISDQLNTRKLLLNKIDSIKIELIKVEDIYARFKDQSKNTVRFKGFTETRRIERNLNLLNQMFLELTTQYELLTFKISENTSSIKIIDTPRFPLKRIGRGRIFYIIIGFVVGLIVSMFSLIILNYIKILNIKVSQMEESSL